MFQLLSDSPKEYERYIFEFSVKNQLRFRGSLGKTVFQVYYCFQLSLITTNKTPMRMCFVLVQVTS